MPYTSARHSTVFCVVLSLFAFGSVFSGQTSKPESSQPTSPKQAVAAAVSQPPEGMTNADVLQLVAAKLPEDIILSAIENALKKAFDLSAVGLVGLKNGGASDEVIRVMQGRPRTTTSVRGAEVTAAPVAITEGSDSAPASTQAANTGAAKQEEGKRSGGVGRFLGGGLTGVFRGGKNKPEDAADIKALQKALEERYKKSEKVVVIPEKVMVAAIGALGFRTTDLDFAVHVDHFAPGLEMPKAYQRRDRLDETTTQDVDKIYGLSCLRELKSGEALQVVGTDLRKRGAGYYFDVLLTAVAAGSCRQGVHFRFNFPANLIEQGDFSVVVREINPYFVPISEYADIDKAKRNVVIQPGMTRDELVKAMGEPLKTLSFGTKTVLTYKDVSVELENGKVVNVTPIR